MNTITSFPLLFDPETIKMCKDVLWRIPTNQFHWPAFRLRFLGIDHADQSASCGHILAFFLMLDRELET